MRSMLKRTRKGFTLLELIVVIVILGILAAISIPSFVTVITKAKDATSTQSLRALNRSVVAIAAFDAAAGGSVNASSLETAIKEITLPGSSAAATPVSGTSAITDSSKIGYALGANGYGIAMRSQSGACLMLVNASGSTTLFKSSPSDTASCTGARALDGQQTTDTSVAGSGGTVVVVPSAPAVNETFSANTQTWTVPATGSYTLSAVGASGGTAYLLNTASPNAGGRGAQVSGTFTLTKDNVIKIAVGQVGSNIERNDRAAGGGGGTYIYNQTTNTPLLVAGGGGGAGQYANGGNKNASLTTVAFAGALSNAGAAGVGGNGGAGGIYSGGGGGMYSNGGSSFANGGFGFTSGGTGGTGYDVNGTAGEGVNGGFGGGGGSYAGGGGGGGYNGGGGGGWQYSGDGGGGSSFNSGTDATATLAGSSGAGSAKIVSK